MGPFNLVLVPKDLSWNLDSHGQDFFQAMTDVTTYMSSATDVAPKYFLSPAELQGRHVSHALSTQLLNPQSALCRVEADLCAMYDFAYHRAVNFPAKDAVIITVTPAFNTFSVDGQHFVDKAHDAIDANPLKNFNVLLCGVEVCFPFV